MQSTNSVFLVRPLNFGYNPETAPSNSFQNKFDDDGSKIDKPAMEEFDGLANILASNGVNVTVFNDTQLPVKPDAVFPNNWITLHADGRVIIYPMCAANRRTERQNNIVETLKKGFIIKEVIDLTGNENNNRFLEGTGSMVFDHLHKIAYACLSPRTDKDLFIHVCGLLKYQPVFFYSHDELGNEIYHTNVMMCVAEKFSVICLDAITDANERKLVTDSFNKTGHEIIDISFGQMKNFAGNMLELRTNENKTILALSESAYSSLLVTQKTAIEKYCTLVPIPIKSIETAGGGSVRCMIAEIFLERKVVEEAFV